MNKIFNTKNFIIKLLLIIKKLKYLTLNTNNKKFLHYLKSINNKTQTLNIIIIYFFHFFILIISKKH